MKNKVVFAIRHSKGFDSNYFEIECFNIPWDNSYAVIDAEMLESVAALYEEEDVLIPKEVMDRCKMITPFKLRCRYNMMDGPYVLNTDDEMTPNEVHKVLEHMPKKRIIEFLKEAKL